LKVFLFLFIILFSLNLEDDSASMVTASGLAGYMAELHSYYLSSPFDRRMKE
jgi:hypothetical protein